jgi:hypothetical protein
MNVAISVLCLLSIALPYYPVTTFTALHDRDLCCLPLHIMSDTDGWLVKSDDMDVP